MQPARFLLSNGRQIPAFGVGTYASGTPDFKQVLRSQIVEIGFRHVDTAAPYGNEAAIGEVLADVMQNTAIRREDLFVTTKLWYEEQHDVPGALKRSLSRLGLEYVDLYLIHWPFALQGGGKTAEAPRVPMYVQWAGMEECVRLGLARAIGTANLNFQLLNDILTYAKVPPAANQIELYPYLTQESFVGWMKGQGIMPIGYSPLGRPYHKQEDKNTALLDPVIKAIAVAHDATPAQVMLAWAIARGYPVIPKSGSISRSKENFGALALKLTREEVGRISALNRNFRTVDQHQIPELFGGMPMYD